MGWGYVWAEPEEGRKKTVVSREDAGFLLRLEAGWEVKAGRRSKSGSWP
jgi:hypothetical protein